MEDTRPAESAIDMHTYGPSDADQVTVLQREVDELRSEVAHLTNERTRLERSSSEAILDRDACRQVIRDLYCRLGLDGLAKTIAKAEAQMQEARIPF